jgi:uncharacterized protein (DUF58 family)
VFLLISLLVGLAGVRSEAPLLFVLFGAMLGGVYASGRIARRMVGGVSVRRDVPARVWQNQTVALGYYLRNERRRGSALGLTVREAVPEGLQCATGFCVHLTPRSVFRSGGRFVARRRGRIGLKEVRVSTRFPFGLVDAHQRLAQPATLVVWPARGHIKGRLLHHGAVQTSQAAPSGASGGQDEFFGLRDYRSDDNPRWIHWRRSAARPNPVVREMARPLPEVLFVVVDTFCDDLSGLGGRTRERMLRFAATLIDHAFSRGYQVGAAVSRAGGAVVHPPRAGLGQRCALLDALADVDANAAVRLAETIGRIEPRYLRNALVVVVTPSAARLGEAPLEALGGACRQLTAVTERDLPAVFEDDSLAEAAELAGAAACPC